MVKILFPVFFLFLSSLVPAQVSGVVIDAETKAPVPYVNIWIEDASFGTTANDSGKFELGNTGNARNLVFSAVGYETTKAAIGQFMGTIYLKPKPLQLEEIKVGNAKNCDLKLGKIKGKKVSFVQHSKDGTHGTPFILARYFPNTCNKPLFLKKVKLGTSASRKARFNLRIYSVGDDGAPKDFLYDKNIFAFVSQIKLSTTVDLRDLKVQVPQGGFFLAVEWLIIDENKRGPGSKHNATSFTFWDPGITAVEHPGNTDSWINTGGSWKRQEKHTIEMEVELSE